MVKKLPEKERERRAQARVKAQAAKRKKDRRSKKVEKQKDKRPYEKETAWGIYICAEGKVKRHVLHKFSTVDQPVVTDTKAYAALFKEKKQADMFARAFNKHDHGCNAFVVGEKRLFNSFHYVDHPHDELFIDDILAIEQVNNWKPL